ncbi:MAG TPA: GatB/YqeY domain-containing protein [Polyangiaceae bacterium]
MLIDEIKTRLLAARQARDPVANNVLGLALGEIQTAEARANRALAEDEAMAVVRKLVKSNEETLAHVGNAGGDATRGSDLRREIEVLSSLLPKALTAAAVADALAPVADAVRAAKTEGQAMGVAMKHLKTSGAVVESAAVQEAIKRLRSGS